MEKQKDDTVKKGDKVAITYIGKLDTGKFFDFGHTKKPYTYIVGSGKVLPAFDQHIIGMHLGEEKTFRILHNDAYGELKGELLIEVPKEFIPKHIQLKLGMYLDIPLKSLGDHPYPVQVTRIGDVSVSINANHPLAGRDLIYTVKVLAIKHPK